jgi:hypothetical protein
MSIRDQRRHAVIRFARAAWVVTFVHLVAVDLRADTLFSNLGQSPEGNAGVGLAVERVAADFVTGGSDATITGATLRLVNQDNISHNVTVSLWSESGIGTPDALLGSFDPISIPSAGFNDYSFSSAGIDLDADIHYWVVMQIHENFNVNGVGWLITSSHSADPGSVFSLVADTQAQYSGDSGDTWQDNFPYEFQFSLLPEPDRFTQLGASVLALALLRRRRASSMFTERSVSL